MRKSLKVFISVLLGALFLWFAFRKVDLNELIEAASGISYGWILPFVAATLFSHFIRALRWNMLINDVEQKPSLLNLYTGVMFGYLTNIALPRVGELTRPVYVARQIDESNSKMIGTIVLERVIDLLSMLFLMVLVVIFLVSDPAVLSNLFGVDITDSEVQSGLLINALLFLGAGIMALGILVIVIRSLSKGEGWLADKARSVLNTGKTFTEGLLTIRNLKNWPLFVFYTLLIWFLYICMTYIPFGMFEMHTAYGLTFTDAIVLTVVSAVGISIPTPGGIGTYHLFITQSLLILFAVPEVVGLSYATITHAGTIIVVLISSPLLLVIDKWASLKSNTGKEQS
ncbi:lysylphosphatidylglycerol synthase transmembrane domain-containing protein [Balneola sp. MJW-20]|uniref:lysylphosphatidylglycerol synthase transmembrane domain-containing protein n=1 Tax=Gracilimonas aurantiaca TaxID=3234185 RepID=UPI003464F132